MLLRCIQTIKYAKTQSNVSIFGCAMAKKKTDDGDDITFVERNLWRFLLLYVKRYDIFGILR